MIGIYKITNKVNGKIYIGQSVDIQRRWSAHKRCSKDYPLYRDFKKYGLDNFTFEILLECSREELNEKEEFFIIMFDATNPTKGYNQTLPGSAYGHGTVFDKDLVEELYEDLLYTEYSKEYLAQKYHCNERTIRDINAGRAWHNDELSYPLREYFIGVDGKKYYCKQNPNLICPRCGHEKYPTASYCEKCDKELRRAHIPQPDELIRLVATCGFSEVGRRYGVTGNSVKKWCKSYGLPYLKQEIVELYKNRK